MEFDKINPFQKETALTILLIILVFFAISIWSRIFIYSSGENAIYFLNIGQGDSGLITLKSPDGRKQIKIISDTGRDQKVTRALAEALGSNNNKYIDIVILSHEDMDHMGGTVDLLKNYRVGILVWNGRMGTTQIFELFKAKMNELKIPSIILGEGDSIIYGDSKIKIISPDQNLLRQKDANEASIVFILESQDKQNNIKTKALYTGDIGIKTENLLIEKGYDLRADILKVGHHGSPGSSGENFIAAVDPVIAGIGVGKNKYGHPAERVIEFLNLAGSEIYRTDQDGTIKIYLDKNIKKRKTFGSQSLLASLQNMLLGEYKENSIKEVSLLESRKFKKESKIISRAHCSFAHNRNVKNISSRIVIFSKIAWMGSKDSPSHEWIELKNLSGAPINLSGWQILNENEKIKFIFPQGAILESRLLLARAQTPIEADYIFTGAIRNSHEALRLFDNNCHLIDEVWAWPKWPGGNNETKEPYLIK